MSIKDNLIKIKSYKKTLLNAIILVLTVILSYSFGRFLSHTDARAPIVLGTFEAPSIPISGTSTKSSNILPTAASIESDGIVVASKQGKTYHYPWCSGAKRISPINKIVFASQAEAQKAGYEPAKNCKGLVEK